MSWVVAAWERLPARARIALVGLGTFLAAVIAVFFRGKRAGERGARAEVLVEKSKRLKQEADEVRALADAGDDTAVQSMSGQAFKERQKRRGRV
jgi:type II secretory pathway component PulM